MSSSRRTRTAAAGVVTAGALTAALAVTPSAVASAPVRHNPLRTPTTATSAHLPGTTCPVFPADNIWHADVSHLPVNAHSASWLSHMQASTRNLHPDFGPSGGFPYGIPYTVVSASHPTVSPVFDFASESDAVGYPLGADTLIEGGVNSGGDMHALMVSSATCRLYETWDTRQVGGTWHAGSGATWDMGSDALRPAGWTSADAAGLPILPGLLRWDEVVAGNVDHAIRFTTNITDQSYVWPARHQAGSVADPSYPPMGAWFRLRANYPTAGLAAATVVIIDAMKTHGMILADNGSPWYFQGTADNSWPDTVISQLKSIPAAAFEAVDVSSLQVSASSGAARTVTRGPVRHYPVP